MAEPVSEAPSTEPVADGVCKSLRSHFMLVVGPQHVLIGTHQQEDYPDWGCALQRQLPWQLAFTVPAIGKRTHQAMSCHADWMPVVEGSLPCLLCV